MVKANPHRDYYRDLECKASADDGEIKKQYFKLARLYHPDRNPGRVEEYTPKFQAIQEAYEILADPAQRKKYDQERQRVLQNVKAFRSNLAPTKSAQSPASAFPASPNGSGPGRQPQFPQRPDFAKSHTGSKKFTDFPPPPQRWAKPDAQSKASAWQRMNKSSKNAAQEKAGNGGAQAQAQAKPVPPPRPGAFGRSQTSRPASASRKPGFDPTATGPNTDERQATGHSGYFTSRFASRAPPMAAEAAAPSTHDHMATPLSNRNRSSSNVSFKEGGERVRSPYTARTGEQTYFSTDELRRSASVRDAARLPRTTTSGTFSQSSSTSSRHRSVSPQRRNHFENPPPNLGGFQHMHSHSARDKVKAADPRRFFDISYSDSDSDADAQPHSATAGKQYASAAGNNPIPSRPIAQPSSRFGKSLYGQHPVHPASPAHHSPLGREGASANTFSTEASSQGLGGNAQDSNASHRQSGTHRPAPAMWAEAKSKSDENIGLRPTADTQPRSFDSMDNPFAAPPTGTTSTVAPGRRSPIKGKVRPQGGKLRNEAYPNSASTGNVPHWQTQYGAGPATPGTQATSPTGKLNAQSDSPRFSAVAATAGFSNEQWQEKLHGGAWAFPKGVSQAASRPPVSENHSRKGSVASARGHDGNNAPHDAPEVAVPVGGWPAIHLDGPTNHSAASSAADLRKQRSAESERSQNATSESSTQDGDEMDIDDDSTREPGASAANGTPKGPDLRVRDVPLQAHRPDWRDDRMHKLADAILRVPRARSRSGSISLEPLSKVAPFAPAQPGGVGPGLQSTAELAADLPFPSAASATHPLKPAAAQSLVLPPMPVAPSAPGSGRITAAQWHDYRSRFAAFLRSWADVEARMARLFEARKRELDGAMRSAASRPGGLEAWLAQQGEGKDETGWISYLRGVREDGKVREHWNLLLEKHRDAVEAFAKVRERVAAQAVMT